ncbi:MAG: OmpH family outer membrane protein [Dysgonamonadaceae bacterium]
MKKSLLLICLFSIIAVSSAYAQKYALIDMEYILKKIPAVEQANNELEEASKQWQAEIEAQTTEVEALYKKYQKDFDLLKGDEKTRRENEIVEKENQISNLSNSYFGPDGELLKRREEFMKPIQDEIYEAIKSISNASGYQMVIDRASATSIIFASPSIDISDQVLEMLGN